MSIWSALMGTFGNRWTFNKTWVLPAGNTNVQTMRVHRNKKTKDGAFGKFDCDYSDFTCVTVENLFDLILPGRYRVTFDESPRLGYVTPHLAVPDRDAAARARGQDEAGIRLHKFNEPEQGEGCIGVGQIIDGDAVDWSKKAFDELMLLTDKNKETWIEVTEEYSVGNA